MEIKQNITLSVKKDDKEFIFIMPLGSTWGNSIDAAFEILQEINKLAQQAVESAKPQEIKE